MYKKELKTLVAGAIETVTIAKRAALENRSHQAEKEEVEKKQENPSKPFSTVPNLFL